MWYSYVYKVRRAVTRAEEETKMFGIGTQELIVILIIALIVIGPNRLPEIGRILGRGLREIKKAADEIKDQVSIEIGNIDEKDIKQNEIRDVIDEEGKKQEAEAEVDRLLRNVKSAATAYHI